MWEGLSLFRNLLQVFQKRAYLFAFQINQFLSRRSQRARSALAGFDIGRMLAIFRALFFWHPPVRAALAPRLLRLSALAYVWQSPLQELTAVQLRNDGVPRTVGGGGHII